MREGGRREGGRELESEGERKVRREGGWEIGREGRSEGGREGRSEGVREGMRVKEGGRKVRREGERYSVSSPPPPSLPPSFPSSGLGLDRFRSLHIEQWKKERSEVILDESSVFSQLGHHGLISFSDYLFLLTIISSEGGTEGWREGGRRGGGREEGWREAW